MTRLQRGVASGRWSATHLARARAELGRLAQRRQRFVENATIYNPSMPLVGKDLRSMVDNLVSGEVAPLKRQAAGVQAAGDQAAGNIESMFRSLAESQARSIQRQGQTSAAASGAVAGANQAQQAQLEAAGAASQRGLPAGLPAEYTAGAAENLAKQIATEKAMAAQTGEARSAQTAQQGQAYEAYQNALAGSAQLQGAYESGRTRQGTQSRVNEILAQISDVEGPGRTKMLNDLRASERQWLGEQAAFNIKANPQITPYQRAQLGLQRRQQNITKAGQDRQLNQWGYTAKEWRSKSQAERQSIIKQQKRWGMKPKAGTKEADIFAQAEAYAGSFDRLNHFFTRDRTDKKALAQTRRNRLDAVDQMIQKFGPKGLTRDQAQRIVNARTHRHRVRFKRGR